MIPLVAKDLRASLAEQAGCAEVSDVASVVLWILDQVFSLEAIRLDLRQELHGWQHASVCGLSLRLNQLHDDELTQLVVRCHDAGLLLSIEPLNRRRLQLGFIRTDCQRSIEASIVRIRTRSYFGPVLSAEVPV